MMSARRGRGWSIAIAAVAATIVTPVAAPVSAAPSTTRLAERLVRRVDVGDANRHLIALQRIADSNGGTRASGTPGFAASADYVAGKLEAAGFAVTRQQFEFEYAEVVTAEFERITPPAAQYEYSDVNDAGDFAIADLSGNGEVSGVPVSVDVVLPPTPAPSSTSGCEAGDFAGFPAGSIALIQRGTCTFAIKAQNAQDAGASAVIMFNEGQAPDRLGVVVPGIDPGITIPVIFTTFAIGSSLATTPGIEVRVATELIREQRPTTNIIAETRTGRPDNVVMAGAHLDSVLGGPGINDNGSGSAGLLETALELGSSPRLANNRVRFAWWGAEESGLVGSTFYVSQLSNEQKLDIALYLNFDMIASPNAGYFVYDGDGSEGGDSEAGPYGSGQIEKTFVEFFHDQLGIDTEGTAFDGRSDYGPFIADGTSIPSGGLFTGAEDDKTPAQAAKWGGKAGQDFDPCYHQACDNLGNINRVAFDRNLDAVAWVVGLYATSTEDINGVPARQKRAAARTGDAVAPSATTAADAA